MIPKIPAAPEPGKAGDPQAVKQYAPSVMIVREHPVMLADRVAELFGVTTGAINQAVTRRPELYTDEHTFVLTEEEFESLVSQSVIPKPGRGGNRFLPRVFTQKGVIRVATTLRSPTAVAATDLVIDLFLEVHAQIARGQENISITNPDRLRPDPDLRQNLAKLRARLVQALDGLLDTVIDPRSQTTVRDEISEITGGALSMVKAHLQTKQIENEKLEAETLLILEKVNEIRQRTIADTSRTAAETEGLRLDNLDKKIALVERLLKMAADLEPAAVVTVLQQMESAGNPPQRLLATAPVPAKGNP